MKVARAVEQKLGKILIDKKIITEADLNHSLEEQAKSGDPSRPIGSFLIDLGFASEKDVTEALGVQFNMAVVDLDDVTISKELIKIIPESVATKFLFLPLFLFEKELTIALADPTSLDTLTALGLDNKYKIQTVLALRSQLEKFIELNYTEGPRSISVETDLQENGASEGTAGYVEKLKKAGKETPIIKLVDKILMEAVEEGASDIHVEPAETKLMIRYRIDGVLKEQASFVMSLHPAVVSRFKILSNLDISERQKPQDGRIQFFHQKKEIDLRVSTLPTHFGEKIVLRLLDRSKIQVKLEDLGFSEDNYDRLSQIIFQPHGIVLVTGPTGSGKSTTLYAILNTIRSIEKNIITVEDPVEYQLALVNQVQVNLKKDLTFATALRAILRQDPDVIMIGEIRDTVTGQIATESALTGHLVFSTLHTNDALSSITRLVDMGIEPFLLAPSILGVVAQRLVRKICQECKESYRPKTAELARFGLEDLETEGVLFYKGKGCSQCKKKGYKGRIGIHEVLLIDEQLRELIIEGASIETMKEAAFQNRFAEMRVDGIKKILSGLTTSEEVLRATRSEIT
ncbi:MAG: Flp pilus assembly complex ATPase component TadA [Nitrospirae bacterium]|nr:Flp pilus assembly complex ATPase component TadA [Nitrospirota bacterium]MBI3593636.1 Flp pilus assembly complex ATPase component TadA [Nitrospirota bacterium]